MADKCRSCEAPIRWAVTGKGRRMPLDAQPSPDGTIAVEPEDELGVIVGIVRGVSTTQPRFVSHFATCPNAGGHRRKR